MKHLKLLLTLFMGALCSADLMADDVTWTSGTTTVTLVGNTLTVSPTAEGGAMGDFSNDEDYSLWRDPSYKNNFYKVIIEEGVTRIGNYAFASCYSLNNITIPSSVTSISSNAFAQVSTISTIYCWVDPSIFDKNWSFPQGMQCSIYVNAKYFSDYRDKWPSNEYYENNFKFFGGLLEEEDYSNFNFEGIYDVVYQGVPLAISRFMLARTFRGGSYNTFSVPFYLDESSLKSALGNDVVVKKLVSSSISNNTLYMNFETVTSNENEPYIEANKPYLIKVSTDVVNPVFKFVSITKTARDEGYNPSAGCVTFVPSSLGKTSVSGYGGSTDEMSVLFLGGNNTLYNPTVDGDSFGYIKGFRGYFQVHPEVQQNIRAYQMNFGDEESTGIQMLNVDEEISGAATGIYTLDGRCLNDMPTEKVLYIVNGKKVMIK